MALCVIQVINAHVVLHMLEVGKGTTESMIAATVTQLVQKVCNTYSYSNQYLK